MKIKKYLVNSLSEAKEKVKDDLGNDAVILHSKEIQTGGFLGFFTKKKLEVIVAVDPEPKKIKAVKEIEKKPQIKPLEAKPIQVTQKQDHALLQELHSLKEMVQTLKKPNAKQEYPEPFQSLSTFLSKQGVTEAIRESLIYELVKGSFLKDDAKTVTNEEAVNQLKQLLKDKMKATLIQPLTFNKKYLQIVGPTGVGKTTTIAKIAAITSLKQQKKVAFITTDTYRIAAVEQLKTYAKILEIPLEVAYNLEDLQKAKEAFAEYDLVIIDTAGRNFRDPLYVKELSTIIDFKEEATTSLVVSLTSKYDDIAAIIEQFSMIEIEQLILTKMDETSTYGAMINLPLEQNKGIAYISNGQNVPDDLIEATPSFLIEKLLEGYQHA
ncbi:flagellar biosynthesis protein FlhF [Alkalihalobacillus trypoxylicola]|uniref:Flagellar biosynthesis protein FlhF n=1 Tax=Alkalihalobacillus trypoxylicola TaxID=519424 RepID=A0A162F8J1_9BACI|nr:flagellar biosynthesis protein FlhF [Alkalihalobacillus trypoxylicola]KYG35041.1 flagellar biosynthesis protein FlhF [Alkalihalobacillus trypoxylicola]